MEKNEEIEELRVTRMGLKRRPMSDQSKEPAGPTPKSQADFLYPPGHKPRDRNPEGLKKLLEKRRAEERASNDAFEEEFRSGTDDPLTDSVRAARRTAGMDRRRDLAEYESAYNA